jgi:hypothetical protein
MMDPVDRVFCSEFEQIEQAAIDELSKLVSRAIIRTIARLVAAHGEDGARKILERRFGERRDALES